MVIFGAGASYDSSPVFAAPAPDVGGVRDERYRPPLTKDLFATTRLDGAFDAAFDAYPQIQTIGAFLRRIPEGTTLEQRLAQLQAEAKDVPARYRELMAVRFYLQQILWTTPQEWYWRSHRASNYSTVLGRLGDWQAHTKEPVALVTFNYDTLLDLAYAEAFGFNPGSGNSFDLEGYVANPDFLLFKPHGSVNWARRIEPIIGQVFFTPGYIIDRASLVKPTDQFEIVENHSYVSSRVDASALIPALAIPMEAKSIFECPARHKDLLIERIPEVTRLLTIGWRASEHLFLELWPGRVNKALKIHIVSPGGPAAIQASLRTGGIDGAVSLDKMGFTDFAEHGRLAELLPGW